MEGISVLLSCVGSPVEEKERVKYASRLLFFVETHLRKKVGLKKFAFFILMGTRVSEKQSCSFSVERLEVSRSVRTRAISKNTEIFCQNGGF